MKEEYGFLCVGQAASNIGVQFERLGYNVLYVNTSSEDLNLLKDSSHKYHVEGGEGCAKDRDKAKALLANDIDTLVDLVRTKLPERLIFVVFASGGGTGSGLSPYLLGVLVEEFGADEYDPEKRFAAVTYRLDVRTNSVLATPILLKPPIEENEAQEILEEIKTHLQLYGLHIKIINCVREYYELFNTVFADCTLINEGEEN